MSGVFLSYSRGDRDLASRVVHGLRALGVEIWWDEDMRGVDWQDELKRQIGRLDAVIVLWTAHSVASKNVGDEARLALAIDKLVNVMWEVPLPPFPYDRVNAMPLDGWNGRDPHRGWTRLVETIEERMVATGAVKPGEVTGALARRENEYRAKRKAVTTAHEAFQAAQLAQTDAEEAAAAAAATASAAEAQLQRVIEIHASASIRHAAQAELDAALAAKAAAEEAHRTARAGLSEASRKMTRAERELEKLFGDDAEPLPPPAPVDPAIVEPVVFEPPVEETPPLEASVKVEAAAPEPEPAEPAPAETVVAAAAVVTEPAAPIAASTTPIASGPAAAPTPAKPSSLLGARLRALGVLMFSFQGRIGRQNFWFGQVGALFGLLVFTTILAEAGMGNATVILVGLYFWASVALDAKRCHDRGRTAWYTVICMVPLVGWIWGVVDLGFKEGEPGPNRYGPPPLSSAQPAAATA